MPWEHNYVVVYFIAIVSVFLNRFGQVLENFKFE